VIGAKAKYQEGWIPTEVYTLNLLDVRDWQRCFLEGSVDTLLAEHVWEHLRLEEGVQAARMCYQYLKPGGHLRVAVPDGFFPDPAYIDFVKPGGNGPSADDHKMLYNYRSFSDVFSQAGFQIELLEYFDETGQFHEREWNPDEGKIIRSKRFYNGHQFGGIKYRSLILDAIKAPR
jgi:predicted SAM-dependent methyltransferase